jgi:hypothetical protein
MPSMVVCHKLPLLCHVQCLYMTWYFVCSNFKRRSNLARKCVLCYFLTQLEKQKFCSKRISCIVKSDHQFTIVTIRMKYVKLSFDLQNSACVFAVGVPFVILYLKFSGNSCSGRRRWQGGSEVCWMLWPSVSSVAYPGLSAICCQVLLNEKLCYIIIYRVLYL